MGWLATVTPSKINKFIKGNDSDVSKM